MFITIMLLSTNNVFCSQSGIKHCVCSTAGVTDYILYGCRNEVVFRNKYSIIVQ